MPIYEYRCDNCAHEFETIQKVSDEPLKTCPACSADALRKKVSAAGFRLKGGGWYETDFKAGSKKNVAGEDKASKSGAEDGAKASGNGGDAAGKTDSAAKSGGDSAKPGADAKSQGGTSTSGPSS